MFILYCNVHFYSLRSRPDLNRSTRFCKPLPNHSATRPFIVYYIAQLHCFASLWEITRRVTNLCLTTRPSDLFYYFASCFLGLRPNNAHQFAFFPLGHATFTTHSYYQQIPLQSTIHQNISLWLYRLYTFYFLILISAQPTPNFHRPFSPPQY